MNPRLCTKTKFWVKILEPDSRPLPAGGSRVASSEKLVAVLKQDWRDCGRIRLSSRAAAKLRPTPYSLTPMQHRGS